VDKIKDVRERILHVFGAESEFAEKGVLRNGVRLSHDKVVSVWEKLECVLQEVDRSAIDCSFHTE